MRAAVPYMCAVRPKKTKRRWKAMEHQYPAVQVVDFYEGTFKLPAELFPAYWHPRAREVRLIVDLPPHLLEALVAEASQWGWTYNPFTKTFTK